MEKELITVLMPVYNGQKFIKEAIESVLAQTYTNFEFIIVNDGSTDDSLKIIESFKDDRIIVHNKEHRGIVDQLNFGIKEAKGSYIARFDCDDIMEPNRLELQLEYFKTHDVDIVGTSMNIISEDGIVQSFCGGGRDEELTLECFAAGNCLSHPTTMMKKSSLDKLPFLYEGYYVHAEDYKLWVTALIHGLKLHNMKEPLIKYRSHSGQVTSTNWDKQCDSARKIKNIVNFMLSDKKATSKMTSIITFKNEGNEIEKTVASIRATTDRMHIILLNDGSDDDTDYKKVAELYGCYYFKMKSSLGVAKARDYGISQSPTEFFCIFDGHMRFYQYDWDKEIVDVLEKQPNSIVTTNSLHIWRREDNSLEKEDGGDLKPVAAGNGAIVRMNEEGWEFTPIFNGCETDKKFKNDTVVPISTVFGAVYASSITHWNSICGLHGLISWGYDEPMMSIKTWLAGGQCLLVKDLIVGHIYRDKAPYHTNIPDVDSNQLYLINLLADETEIDKYERKLRKRIGFENFDKAYALFSKRYFDCLGHRSYFFKNAAKYKIGYFYDLNEDIKKYKNKKKYLIKKKDKDNY